MAFKQDFFTAAMVSERGFAGGGSRLAIRTDELDSTHSKRIHRQALLRGHRRAHGGTAHAAVPGAQPLRHPAAHWRSTQFSKIIDLGLGHLRLDEPVAGDPIFNFLDGWGWSYGIIILVLTLAIELLLALLTYKNLKSSAKMKALKPEQEAITEKYKDGDQLKKQQAVMDLYRKAGVNPRAAVCPC